MTSPPARHPAGDRAPRVASRRERRSADSTVSERELTGYVRDVARAFGWRRYHTWLSKHSPAGFPDEVLVRSGLLIFAELKSARGKLSDEQEAWLEELRAVPGVEVYEWRPADMDAIATVLR